MSAPSSSADSHARPSAEASSRRPPGPAESGGLAAAAFPAVEIETARLMLRVLHDWDAGDIVRLAGDPSVSSMTGRIPFPYAQSDAQAFIAAQAPARAAGTMLSLAVTSRDDGAFLGIVGMDFAASASAEIGYWLGRPFWGRGFGTEASRALIDHAFETARIEAVNAACRVTNEASRRVLEKCGLHYVSSGLAPAPARGGAQPVDRFRLSRRDWESFKAWRPAVVRSRGGEEASDLVCA